MSLLSIQELCEEVRPVYCSGDMCSQTFSHANSLSNKIITDRVRLLLQDGLGIGGVVNNRHVITIYISWAVNLERLPRVRTPWGKTPLKPLASLHGTTPNNPSVRA